MDNVTPLQDYQPQNYSCLLGFDPDRKEDVTLGDIERRGGLYVLGRPRFGKTTLLLNLMLQDIEHEHGVFFLDPHGDATKDLLDRIPSHRVKDVLVLDPMKDDPFYFSINALRCKDPTNVGELFTAHTRVYNIFYKVWEEDWGVWLELILDNLIYAFLENPGYSVVDFPLFLRDKPFRDYIVNNITINKQVADFWKYDFAQKRERDQQAQMDAAKTRIETLLLHPPIRYILGRRDTTLDFTKLINSQKIILLRLSARMAQNARTLLGTILISELLDAAYGRENIPPAQRKQFPVFIDEFQNFATPDFAKLFTELGKFAIAPAVAHQERRGQFVGNNLIRERVLGATAAAVNMVIYQPTVIDSQEIAPEFSEAPPPAEMRDEPIFSLPQSPVDRLSSIVHPNPTIQRITTKYLKPLTYWAARMDANKLFGNLGTHASREQLLSGQFLLDKSLTEIMQYTIREPYRITHTHDSVQVPLALAGFIGFLDSAKVVEVEDKLNPRYPRFKEEIQEIPVSDEVRESVIDYMARVFSKDDWKYGKAEPIHLDVALKLQLQDPEVEKEKKLHWKVYGERFRKYVAAEHPPFDTGLLKPQPDSTRLYTSNKSERLSTYKRITARSRWGGIETREYQVDTEIFRTFMGICVRYHKDPITAYYLRGYKKETRFESSFFPGQLIGYATHPSWQSLRELYDRFHELIVKGYLLAVSGCANQTDIYYQDLPIPRIENKSEEEVVQTLKDLTWVFERRVSLPAMNIAWVKETVGIYRQYKDDPELAGILRPYQNASFVKGFLLVKDDSVEFLQGEMDWMKKQQSEAQEKGNKDEATTWLIEGARILVAREEVLQFAREKFIESEIVRGYLLRLGLQVVKEGPQKVVLEERSIQNVPIATVTKTVADLARVFEKHEQDRLVEEMLMKHAESIYLSLHLTKEDYDKYINYYLNAIPVDKEKRDNLHRFSLDLVELSALLSEPENIEPLKVISGYEKKATGQVRSEQDMINEAARKLRELPKYTAYYHIAKEEHGIQRLQKGRIEASDLPRVQSEAIIKSIQGQAEINTRLYQKHRGEIEQEIEARQAPWTGRPPMRTAQPGDKARELVIDEAPSRYGPALNQDQDENSGQTGAFTKSIPEIIRQAKPEEEIDGGNIIQLKQKPGSTPPMTDETIKSGEEAGKEMPEDDAPLPYKPVREEDEA